MERRRNSTSSATCTVTLIGSEAHCCVDGSGGVVACPSDSLSPCWFVDETYVRVAGVGQAVDQYRQVIDALVSKRRNVAAGSVVFRHECCGAQPEHVLRSAVERLTSNH
jgi:hypothetical protein